MPKRKGEPASLFDPERTPDPDEEAAVSTETAPPADELPAESARSAEVPFTMATWKGLPQWRCRRCPFDTVAGEAAMLEHIREAHESPTAPRPRVAVFDRWGREVAPAEPGPSGPATS